MAGSRVHSVNSARANHMRMELGQQWDSLSIQLGLKAAIMSYLSHGKEYMERHLSRMLL